MEQILKNLFDEYGISYTTEQINQLTKFYKMVVETNEKFNLTAITEENDFAIKHILDSILPISLLPQNASVIDVGAGAGFPSIPLKILRPDLNITMLDSLNKRVNFLNDVIVALNLKNITAVHARAEDYAIKNREKFDIAIARAVASLVTLSEYCLPFVKVGGKFIALKGSSLNEELLQANYAIQLLGGKTKDIQKIYVKQIDATRENLTIEKVKPTDKKYPRGKNLPRLKPLVASQQWIMMTNKISALLSQQLMN